MMRMVRKRQWIIRRMSVTLEGRCRVKWSNGIHGSDSLCRDDDDVSLCTGTVTVGVTILGVVIILVIVIMVLVSSGGRGSRGSGR